jgi:hypothetical protein
MPLHNAALQNDNCATETQQSLDADNGGIDSTRPSQPLFTLLLQPLYHCRSSLSLQQRLAVSNNKSFVQQGVSQCNGEQSSRGGSAC